MSEKSTEYALSLGSNLGDREGYIRTAVRELSRICQIKSVSSLYSAESWGKKDDPEFINIACIAASDLKPVVFLRYLHEIELQSGRQRFVKWEPRVIDIDILLAGKEIIDENGLQIPHPYMTDRRFVLVPLAEIVPGMIHPVENVTVKELLNICSDKCKVSRMKSFNL